MSWKLGSGEVVVDRKRSHLHGDVRRILPDLLARVRSQGSHFVEDEVAFDRVIGRTNCVPTSEKDKIVFARRPNRAGKTRFVLGRQPEPCSSAVVVLKRIGGRKYLLITAYIGRKAGPEPWDRHATSESKKFWAGHALVWGYEPVEEEGERRPVQWHGSPGQESV